MYKDLFNLIYNVKANAETSEEILYDARATILNNYLQQLPTNEANYLIDELKKLKIIENKG